MGEDTPATLIRLPWGDWVDPRCIIGVQFYGDDEDGWQITVLAVASGNGFQFNSSLYESEDEVNAMMEKTMLSISRIPDN